MCRRKKYWLLFQISITQTEEDVCLFIDIDLFKKPKSKTIFVDFSNWPSVGRKQKKMKTTSSVSCCTRNKQTNSIHCVLFIECKKWIRCVLLNPTEQ